MPEVDATKQGRIDELLEEMEYIDSVVLAGNPLNASANARYKYLKTLLDELLK